MFSQIEVARTLGFCFGVSRAVRMAEDAAIGGGRVSTWGPLIHNKWVTERLGELGVTVASDLSECIPGQTVVLRSHGVSPQEREALQNAGCRVLDATCPHVARIHQHVRLLENEGRRIFILGDETHPEVRGTVAYCRDPVIIKDETTLWEFFDNHPKQAEKPVALIAQTTARRDLWDICTQIFEKLCTNGKIIDTICKATLLRQNEAARLAAQCGAMVIVGDVDSSNTRKLADICRTSCPRVLLLERAADWPRGWLCDQKNVGLTAGASTPPWAIKEVYQTMSEEIRKEMSETAEAAQIQELAPDPTPEEELALSAETSSQQDVDSEESFASMLEKTFKTINTGDKVIGVVTAVTATEIHVDLGAKHAGYIPLSELTDDPDARVEDLARVGQEIEACVTRVNDVEGVIALSKRRLDSVNNWNDVELARESHVIMSGIVTEENKGGVVVTVKGIRVFVPASLTGLPKETPMSTLLKQRVKVCVTEVNRARRRVVGSIRAAQNEERRKQSETVWKEIEVGKHYQGLVKSLTSYGCFVDIGGVDGMVHVSELTWRRIKHPSEAVAPGQKIDVYVIGFDREKKKISLGHKDPNENPWQKFIDTFRVGDTVNVRVVKLMPFGAFSEVIPGVDGLIHIGQITDRRIGKPGDVLSEGQQVDAKITAIDYEHKKISLSIRALMDLETPSEETQAKYASLPDEVVASATADAPPAIPSMEEPPQPAEE